MSERISVAEARRRGLLDDSPLFRKGRGASRHKTPSGRKPTIEKGVCDTEFGSHRLIDPSGQEKPTRQQMPARQKVSTGSVVPSGHNVTVGNFGGKVCKFPSGHHPSAPRRTKRNPDRHGCPQENLFLLLRHAFPNDKLVWEADGLVPGRNFRADMYFPAHQLVIEVDGFGYHRTKDAFVSDRKRANLFTIHGYRMLNYDNASVRQEVDRILREVSAAIGVKPRI